MIDTIYIEENIARHPRSEIICKRFPAARRILCNRYTEVFNPKAQNFRIQKRKPSLILAEKYRNFVLETPPGYGIGARRNYYFSHMLNCLYDCRYCFLQGMYHSANYVLFVNFESFLDEIGATSARYPDEEIHFFSGYDCDSLAMDPLSGFADSFLDHFEKIPNALLELRTKSTQIRALLNRPPLPNCVVAFSFTPASVSDALEFKVPSVERRIDAIKRLSDRGWKIGLRFDPMIYEQSYQDHYRTLFESVFRSISPENIHSVSFGVFRLPNSYFRRLHRLYPEEKMFAGPLEQSAKMTAYRSGIEEDMKQFMKKTLLHYVQETKLFPCPI